MEDTRLEDIEGEFTPEEPSGFGCGRCGNLLAVGTRSCPTCAVVFLVPTPSLRALNQSRHPDKMRGLALVHKGRLIASEIEALKHRNPAGFDSQWMPKQATQ